VTIILVGATATLNFQFADPDGTLYDPDAGTGLIVIRAPGEAIDEGTEYPIEASGLVEQVSTGIYRLEIDTSAGGGRWHWRASGSEGDRSDVGEGSFRVEFSRVISEPVS
jgi:hypothetical protein